MKTSIWRVPLIALCSSLPLYLIRSLVNPFLLRMISAADLPLQLFNMVQVGFNLVGIILLVLGGVLFCRKMPVRTCALSATIVVGYALFCQIVNWVLTATGLPEFFLRLARHLNAPVAIYSLSSLSYLLTMLDIPAGGFSRVLAFVAAFLPYVYVLFSDWSTRRSTSLYETRY